MQVSSWVGVHPDQPLWALLRLSEVESKEPQGLSNLESVHSVLPLLWREGERDLISHISRT